MTPGTPGFSKAAHFIPLPKFLSAVETGEHMICFHGIPRDIVSDRGSQFFCQVWKAFCSAMGASASLALGYHPQANGQAERANQSLEDALRCVAARNPSTWTHLLWVEYAHNALVLASTELSPFIASLGYQPPLFEVHEDKVAVPLVHSNMRRCRRVWRQVRAALLQSSQRVSVAGQPAPDSSPLSGLDLEQALSAFWPYQLGQKVRLSTKDLPLQIESRKLAPCFVGPFEVEQVVNLAAIRLKLPPVFK